MAKIFIICGHGAGDSGAVGNGYTEAERVRALGKRIKELGGNSVKLGDVNRNYYADKGISSLTISKDYQIVELHMDSNESGSPHGGHVIIKSGFKPDSYDNALADMMKDIFPGRSTLIDKRDDLANPKRAAAKGYGYRLLECGFITNKNDIKTFNSKMDEIAKRILNVFGIKASGSASSSTSTSHSTTKPSTSNTASSKATLKVDGIGGAKTIKRAQEVFGTTVDGIISNQLESCRKYIEAFLSDHIDWDGGKSGSPLVKAIQKWAGIDKDERDGYWGKDTSKAVQTKLGETVDGYFGPKSMKAFQTWLNKQ